MLAVAVAAALAPLAPGVRPARADGGDETEQRLKTAGIDPALRERIHVGIRRGVRWLRLRQAADGSFAGAWYSTAGCAALAGLALRHSGGPDGVEGGRAAIRWLRARPDAEVAQRTYVAGLTALLLTADGSEPEWNHEIHDLLARGPRGANGYWSYRSDRAEGSANLSTAQFACLGLWAGERAGAPVATAAWRLHLEALVRWQGEDGGWGYAPGASAHSTYPNGVFMGIADLLLAAKALDEVLAADPRLRAKARVAEGRARAALRRYAHGAFAGSRARDVRWSFSFGYYGLYALEKAAVFLGAEEIAGLAWYREGAEDLLEAQLADGGWPEDEVQSLLPAAPRTWAGARGDLVQTSFALLFLLRAAETWRPVTPGRGIARRRP